MLPAKIILHPTDFSEPASHAHAAACALARHWNARLMVLHVANKPVVSYIERASELQPEELQKKLWETLRCPTDLENGLQVEHRVAEGHAVAEILRAAREVHADLIVMGTHGHRGILHWFSTNITDQVVRGAGCSVLIERSPAPAVPEVATPEELPASKPLPEPLLH
jgi:nucleotide-binding universal stress UspA family protein